METQDTNYTEVIMDVLSGMDQASLVAKHGISSQTVEEIFKDLVQKGLL